MFQIKLTRLQRLAQNHGFIALAVAGFLSYPALAAPPANDDIANSVVVTEPLPFSYSGSTVEATVATDPFGCYELTHTVWFVYTPTTTGPFSIDTFGSDYDTVVEAYYGAPENGYFAGCSDDTGGGAQSSLAMQGFAGEAIYFMVGSGNGAPGGNLVFNAKPVVVPVVTLSVVEPVLFNPTNGGAHVRLRIESSAPIAVTVAGATVIQPTGRGDISGTEIAMVFQTGTTFEVVIPAIFNLGNNRSRGTGFKGGPARIIGFVGYAYGPDSAFYNNVQLDRPVSLKADASN